jgi:hypothetical protein
MKNGKILGTAVTPTCDHSFISIAGCTTVLPSRVSTFGHKLIVESTIVNQNLLYYILLTYCIALYYKCDLVQKSINLAGSTN